MQLYRDTQSHQHPPRQSKIASQRQYRVKEGDGFQELRAVIRSVTGKLPQTRSDTLKKAAELLRQLSRELGENSRHEPLSELLSASTYEVNQGSHTSYEPPLIHNNETWTNTIAPGTRNNSPMSDTSVTSSMLEYQGHPQTEIHYVVGGGGDLGWNLLQPTPSQFQHTSNFLAQQNDPSFLHSNINQAPYY
ncbi:uncharacterized protein HD556DRAFT_1317247 [Suillus plorans]|uniref:BHLH domain-containing protein n=1 Tax=Suillus plorans TaxID=116603 RepID=A0A9P7E313_9AGAM|nr:uncharacterized protein HD556DRAFT_1317247 [Suillus plorans]KAG1809999.1 hypothetical protein HD556DRAFT_1317247 [Suillus plorans]